jgi:hypothetical protein
MDSAARAALKEMAMSAETKVRGYYQPVWRQMFPELLEAEEQRGIEKGRIEAARRALRAVLEARGLAVGDVEGARIDGCEDAATLEVWLRRAAVAADVGGVFGE